MGPRCSFRHMRRARAAAQNAVMHSLLHTISIGTHVLCGTAALGLGLAQLWAPKGGDLHRRLGRLFTRMVWTVVATASFGLVVFGFRAFLAVLTLLVAYWTYSGVRAVRNRESGPTMRDGAASFGALLVAAAFAFSLPRLHFPWVPSIIYSTLATVTLLALYDLSRFWFPRNWHRELWRYEHAVKMLGAHGAIVAAFSGTVLPGLQPFSQIMPSVLWTILQVFFVVQLRMRASPVDKGRSTA